MKKPPQLPEETLKKVLRVSCLNGWSVALVAGIATAVTLVLGDWFSSSIGLLVTAAGVVEIHGNRLVTGGDPRGCRWLAGSQWFLFSVLFGYCLGQLVTFDAGELLAGLPSEARQMLDSAGLPPSALTPLLRLTCVMTYVAVMVASFFHQGGLLLFYRKRAAAVATALESAAVGLAPKVTA